MSLSVIAILPCSSVAIGPGLMALTRMPRETSSPDHVLACDTSRAFVGAQFVVLGMQIWCLLVAFSTIEAGRARRDGACHRELFGPAGFRARRRPPDSGGTPRDGYRAAP